MKKDASLPKLEDDQFDQFFEELHGYQPFPWQSMLATRCIEKGGWPDVIDLPTASGKTACIDIAIFLLAMQAELPPEKRTTPRRIWFVVNRRIVVDEAYERAKRIAEKLRDETAGGVIRAVAERLKHIGGANLPLAVGRMRGGTPKQVAWSYHPAQPAVITSTVDQIGSRLLFRGYGVGRNSRSIHAALAGNDSLIVLDEAHTANAFRETLNHVRRLRESERDCKRCVKSSFGVVTMSATPVENAAGRLNVFPSPDEREKALTHFLLKTRFNASKPATLIEVSKATAKGDPLAIKAAELAVELSKKNRRVAVMVNRVATAGAIKRFIEEWHSSECDVILLTGRMRPIDRDALIKQYSPRLRASAPDDPAEAKPIIFVTTQCLEVGADFSFDALVSECASLDALRQRFGRLNRLGQLGRAAEAFILIRIDDVKDDKKLDKDKPLDPVYGNAMARTWNWLNENADTKASGSGAKRTPAIINMSVNSIDEKIDGLELATFCTPTTCAPVLLPAYVDLWSQTSPLPAVEPEISLFLHGPRRGAPEAFVVFRSDIPFENRELAQETLELMPPLTAEQLAVPLWKLKKWLAGKTDDEGSDVESEAIKEEDDKRQEASTRSFVRFRGRDDIELNPPLDELRPGDTLVLSAEQWPDELGSRWPDNEYEPIDIYEQAYELANGQQIRRIRPGQPARHLDDEQRDSILKLIESGDASSLGELREIVPDATELDLYPGGNGAILVLGPSAAAEAELDPFAFDRGALLEADLLHGVKGETASFKGHSEEVVKWAVRFAGRVFDSSMTSAIETAAWFHDAGKCDPRFQFCLNNGRRFGEAELMAKSRTFIPTVHWKALRAQVQLPDGFRHEVPSMQIAAKSIADDDVHRDVILHLDASHHGLGRPLMPVSVDEPSCTISFADRNGKPIELSAHERFEQPLHRLDSGVAERFWKLTRTHGWWGLALMEAVLRLADWKASKDGDGESK